MVIIKIQYCHYTKFKEPIHLLLLLILLPVLFKKEGFVMKLFIIYIGYLYIYTKCVYVCVQVHT